MVALLCPVDGEGDKPVGGKRKRKHWKKEKEVGR